MIITLIVGYVVGYGFDALGVENAYQIVTEIEFCSCAVIFFLAWMFTKIPAPFAFSFSETTVVGLVILNGMLVLLLAAMYFFRL